jgi:hypothetical protein
MKRFVLILLACLSIGLLHAQTNDEVKLNLLSPQDYQVFQNHGTNGGRIVIECALDTKARGVLSNLDRLEARLTGSDAWTPLPFDNRVRRFRSELPAPAGGWYRLEVRLASKGEIAATAPVGHVGVGEIFVIAGQSNSPNHGEEKQRAKDPRVVAFGDGHWQPAVDPEPGASGKGGSFMPAFGDAMAARFNVPIALVPVGVGSTSVREWLPAGDAVAAPSDTGRNIVMVGSNSWAAVGELFDHLVAAQKQFGPDGFRAVLWHQGESDSHEPADRQIIPAQYRQYLQRVIEASRAAAGWRVPWFVAQASYHSPTDQGSPEVRAAQYSLVKDGIAFAGPNTDDLGPEFRQNNGQGVHFNARGLQRHGELWANVVGTWLAKESSLEK